MKLYHTVRVIVGFEDESGNIGELITALSWVLTGLLMIGRALGVVAREVRQFTEFCRVCWLVSGIAVRSLAFAIG
jgi:hypothetical protein